jgi:hypothetical protein
MNALEDFSLDVTEEISEERPKITTAAHAVVRQNTQEIILNEQPKWGHFLMQLINVVQLVVSTAILVETWDKDCNVNLHAWLVVLEVITFVRWVTNSFSLPLDRPITRCAICIKWLLRYVIPFFAFIWMWIGTAWISQSDDECPTKLVNLSIVWLVFEFIRFFVLSMIIIICTFYFPMSLIYAKIIYPRRNQQALNKIPTFKFTPQIDIQAEDATCAICTNVYVLNEELRKLPCGHHFHRECVDKWVTLRANCPYCRASLDGTQEGNDER